MSFTEEILYAVCMLTEDMRNCFHNRNNAVTINKLNTQKKRKLT